jgi:hypothetical protein
MTIRIECTTPDLETCFVELTDRWTRTDIAAIFEPGQQPALWRRKVTACQLALASSDAPITDPARLYDEQGEIHPDLDVRLLYFVSAALVLAADSLTTLGKANARLSSTGAERATQTAPATTTT